MMNCLIIGFGSIGRRHAGILKDLGFEVSIVSQRDDIKDYRCFNSIEKAFLFVTPDYVVISNRTSDHEKVLSELISLGFNEKLLIEKPVFQKEHSNLRFDHHNTYIAYNLRFHPIIQDIQKYVKDKRIISMHVYCGQYLPNWRSGSDYKKSYSSSKSQGGGVLRDLSHELDYINWLTDGWQSVTAVGGKFSDLKINSDDTYCILLEMNKCPAVSLQINYVDKKARREIIINTEESSLKADLINNYIRIDSNEKKEYLINKNLTYINQHKAVINGENEHLCSYSEGLDVLRLILSTEEAAKKKIWVKKRT